MPAGEERRADERERDVAERLHAVGAEIGRGLEEVRRRPPQSGDHVVVGDDDAERRVRDHDGAEAEVPPDPPERRLQRDGGDDAG